MNSSASEAEDEIDQEMAVKGEMGEDEAQEASRGNSEAESDSDEGNGVS